MRVAVLLCALALVASVQVRAELVTHTPHFRAIPNEALVSEDDNLILLHRQSAPSDLQTGHVIGGHSLSGLFHVEDVQPLDTDSDVLAVTTREATVLDAIQDADIEHTIDISHESPSDVLTQLVMEAGQDLCTNTCKYKGDGECDDGGPNAQYKDCALGTDCKDCGVRRVQAPKELCTNTCKWKRDGECDDGGPGAPYKGCKLGTDCADCGARPVEGGIPTNANGNGEAGLFSIKRGPELDFDLATTISSTENKDHKWWLNLRKAKLYAGLTAKLSLKISVGSIDHFSIVFEGAAYREFLANIRFEGSTNGETKKIETTVFENKLKDVEIKIGSFTLTFTPILRGRVFHHMNFKDDGFLVYDYGRKFEMRAGVAYNKGKGWNKIWQPPKVTLVRSPPELVTAASASAVSSNVESDISLDLLYRGIIGPALRVRPSGHAAVSRSKRMNVKYTESLHAGASLRFLGAELEWTSPPLVQKTSTLVKSMRIPTRKSKLKNREYFVTGVKLQERDDPGEDVSDGMSRVLRAAGPRNPTDGWQHKHKALNKWLDDLSAQKKEELIDRWNIRETCSDGGFMSPKVERPCTDKDKRQWLWHFLYYKEKTWGYKKPVPEGPKSTFPPWKLVLICKWKGHPFAYKDDKSMARRFHTFRSGLDREGGGYKTNWPWLCTGTRG